VGVNRMVEGKIFSSEDCPHARGGEPWAEEGKN
jgi:hypothetical protein